MAPKSLTIRRCATIYSLTQMDGEPEGVPPPGRAGSPGTLSGVLAPDRPVSELKGQLVPTYVLPASDGYGVKRIRSFGDLSLSDCDTASWAVPSSGSGTASDDDPSPGGGRRVPQAGSLLRALLLAEWEDRAERGLFRYDVTACATRLLAGDYGFVAQLNEGRASKKRPTEFLVDQVVQPFDPAKFNFLKALQTEVLLAVADGAAPGPKATGGSPAGHGTLLPAAPAGDSPHLVFINVSPIDYGHILLVPWAMDCLPQAATPAALRLALRFMREVGDPHFRMAFNSLGAYGTINHLHFQAYFLGAPMALERAPTEPLPGAPYKPRGAPRSAPSLGRLDPTRFPVRALAFEAGDSIDEMADLIGAVCERLSAANVPHNLMVVDCGARVFLYPNAFAERKARGEVPEDILETQVDPAAFETAGHIILKRARDYERADEAYAWRLLEQLSLPEGRFAEVEAIALQEQARLLGRKAPLR